MKNALPRSGTYEDHPKAWACQPVIADSLNIQRGDFPLCIGISFVLPAGHILHIKGPNGVGKTTLLLLLAGLLPFDRANSLRWGEVSRSDWADMPNWSLLYLGHLLGLNAALTVAENLTFLESLDFGQMQPDAIASALEAVGLSGYEDVRVSKLSVGQRRRVSLSRLWLPRAAHELWLLDEPLTALDSTFLPVLMTKLSAHAERGGRIILTSHQPLPIHTEILDLSCYVVDHDTSFTDVATMEYAE